MKKFFNKKTYIVLAAAIGIFFSSFAPTDLFEVSKNLDIFISLYRVLNESYVDETKPGQLMKTAIDAMLESLDPYTNYITENDIEDFMYMTTGEYGGVGAAVTDINGKIIVIDPYEGFSAQRAGIKAGDEIIEVNGQVVKGKKSDDVKPLLKGQAGSPLKIKVIHPGQNVGVEISLMREEIKISAVPYSAMVNNQTGYIKLTSFTENCSVLVKDALLKLKEKNCKSLVLDLRGNPGGLLLEAVNIVNLFVKKGKEVVYTEGKVSDWDKTYVAVNNAIDTLMPIVVLIDENSASAAEIVAGSLQDFDRAVLIGSRSYGKGLVQQTKPLLYNTQIKLTVAKYYIPSGRCVQALDYTHRNEEGRVEKVPDSLITAFKTRGGRIVYDGAGVLPDFKTEEQKLNNVTIALLNKNLIFNYATEYVLKHDKIAAVKDFQLNEKEFDEFINYLKDKDYTYKTETELAFDELKKNAEGEKYFTNMKVEYETLVAKVKSEKKDDLVKYRAEIKQFLEEEIVSRYYYQVGRLEQSVKGDSDIKTAIEVLSDGAKVKSILTTIEKPTKPFNPRKRF
ncbi:MAG TPA: S41 family peptidase [Bacteroidia bacterium]|jgi:carboxyl-terminal processing protease|nr:S41 family peptidase [Bacteroidia bacterium]